MTAPGSVLRETSSIVRSVTRLALVALLGAGGFAGWKAWHAEQEHARELAAKQREIERLAADLDAKTKELERLSLALKLMKVERRRARVIVLDQVPHPTAKNPAGVTTRFRFEEIDENGRAFPSPSGAHELSIEGAVLYVDSWIVKFDDVLIEQGDPLRSASLCLFRRLFGEQQAPSDGIVLDADGKRPCAYGGDERMSALEAEIWGDFWRYANDPARASRLGIRAAHGEAPSIQLEKGKVYVVTLRASGGLTIQPEPTAPGSN